MNLSLPLEIKHPLDVELIVTRYLIPLGDSRQLPPFGAESPQINILMVQGVLSPDQVFPGRF